MNETQLWYAALEKPWFAPPSWLFGPVWSVLYVIIIIVFILILLDVKAKKLPIMFFWLVLINALSNGLFSPLQFGLRSNTLALLDIVVVLGSLVLLVKNLWPKKHGLALWLLPYLAWVSFATVLQASITYLNYV